MRRRELMLLLSAPAAQGSICARARGAETYDGPAAFAERLRSRSARASRLGYVEGRNIVLEYRCCRYVGPVRASYVDRILSGTKPADLTVEQPTKFEITINLA